MEAHSPPYEMMTLEALYRRSDAMEVETPPVNMTIMESPYHHQSNAMAAQTPLHEMMTMEEAANTKPGNNRAVKRPARGFHRFRKGPLNVKPKGHERKLFKENSYTPLLSLPPEVRLSIWEFAIGGITVRHDGAWRSHKRRVFLLPQDARVDPFALLRTCRQIYADAVHLPYSDNLFSISEDSCMDPFKRFKNYQCGQIREIQLEVDIDLLLAIDIGRWIKKQVEFTRIRKRLPKLERVLIRVFPVTHWTQPGYAAFWSRHDEESVNALLTPIFQQYNVAFDYKQMDCTVKEWAQVYT